MRRLLYLLLFCAQLEAMAAPVTISATEWARPRSGEALTALPALAESVQRLLQTPGATLEIRYPGGDEGSLWARELQAWLVALGIASARIELVAGGSHADAVELAVVP